MSQIEQVQTLLGGAASNIKLAAQQLRVLGHPELALHASELEHAATQVDGWAANLTGFRVQEDFAKIKNLVGDSVKLVEMPKEESDATKMLS